MTSAANQGHDLNRHFAGSRKEASDHLFRVVITEYPEGSTKLGWEPPGWPDSFPDTPVGDDAFRWPATGHVYRSKSGAQRRRRLVESYGAKAVVQKSGPVTWPHGHAETLRERLYNNAAVQILGEPSAVGAHARITDPTLSTPSEKLLGDISTTLGGIEVDTELSRLSLAALLQLFEQFAERQNQLVDGLREQLGRCRCGGGRGGELGGVVGSGNHSAEVHESSPDGGEFDSVTVGDGCATGVTPSAPVAAAEPSWMDRPDAVVLHADGKLTWLSSRGHSEISDLVADKIPQATGTRFRDDDKYLIWFQDAVGLPLNPLADRVVQEVDQIKQAFGWRGDVAISRAGDVPLTVADCELIERLATEHAAVAS